MIRCSCWVCWPTRSCKQPTCSCTSESPLSGPCARTRDATITLSARGSRQAGLSNATSHSSQSSEPNLSLTRHGFLPSRTTHVPVGHDQAQHLELARDLAQVFNRQYPGTKSNGKGKGKGAFRLPEVMLSASCTTPSPSHSLRPRLTLPRDQLTDGPPRALTATHPRIYSLRNPAQKMSKSAPHPASKILLTDPYPLIQSKIKSAVTDSLPGVTYDPVDRPGIATLLQIHSGYSGEAPEDIAERFNTPDSGVRALKESTAEAIESALGPFRREFERVRVESGYLEEREREGARRAAERAGEVMAEVRRATGTA